MRSVAATAAVVVCATGLYAAEIEVEVRAVRIDGDTGAPVVQLAEKREDGRTLPIWVGPFEAQAIALELHRVPAGRPQTHDLMKTLVERLGGRVRRVVVEDIRDGTYFARLEMTASDGNDVRVDARPSDAIALALRLGGPIFVEEVVFTKATREGAPAPQRVWGLTLQDLTPELASVLGVSDPHGVLVADVASATPANGVSRKRCT